MCGRIVSTLTPGRVAAHFGAAQARAALAPSYNVAPARDVYVVREDAGVRVLDAFRWGLVPPWAREAKVGARMINARAESLAQRPAFREAFRRRRCLVPADGFYEWKKLPGGKAKQPYYVSRPDGEPYALAGLWERWQGPDRRQPPLYSCAIVTGAPNEAVAQIHDRMPVILPESAWEAWLDGGNEDLGMLGGLLVPAAAELTVLRPVSARVGSVVNDGPSLLERVELAVPG